MFGFNKSDVEQKKQELEALRESYMYALRQNIEQTRAMNEATQKLFSEFVIRQQNEKGEEPISFTGQDGVIQDGGTAGTNFSVRVNTTLKRLEYINRASATDSEGAEWPDADWLPVLRGDFVEYTP
jgi:hypothetical protein